MKPPTEEQLNIEINDGYGLAYEGKPTHVIQGAIDSLKAELDALELTAEMVTDRWRKDEEYNKNVIHHYQHSIEFETEWMDEPDPVAIARDQQRLQEARATLRKEREEYYEGKRKSDEAIQLKKRQIAVMTDILRRSHAGHP